MDRVPLEMLIRHSARTVADFFASKVEEERKAGKVAVLVEDFTNSLYFMPCDTHGYPDYREMKYMTFDSINLAVLKEESIPMTDVSMTVEEVSVFIDRPMLTQRYDWQDKPYVFMWSGRIMSKRKIPLEKLNVSELMKLAQKAVQDREGLVIDEAIKNKIYK